MRTLSKFFGLIVVIALCALPFVAFAQADQPVDGGEIAVGDVIEFELTADAPAVAYTLTVADGQQVIVDLVADDFDSYLALLNEDGDEIATDDDSAGNLDSRLVINTAGTYTVVAQSFPYHSSGTLGEGAYVLTVVGGDISDVAGGAIEFGQEISGELTSTSLEARYTFSGTEGDVIVAQHFSEDYDSYLILEQDGDEIATNDDGAGNLDLRIGPFTLPDTGEYTLVVTSLSRSSTGSFDVTLDLVQVNEIEIGDSAEFTIENAGDLLYVQFEGNSGDIINVTAASKIDMTLALLDPNGYNVSSLTTSSDLQELQTVSLNTDGLYTLVISLSSEETGSIEVTVEEAELASLTEGAQEISFSDTVQNNVLTFEADRNTTYRMTFDLIDGDIGSPSIYLTQDGLSVAYTSASQVQSISIVFTTRSAGEVLLDITDYSFTDITYNVTIEEVGQ